MIEVIHILSRSLHIMDDGLLEIPVVFIKEEITENKFETEKYFTICDEVNDQRSTANTEGRLNNEEKLVFISEDPLLLNDIPSHASTAYPLLISNKLSQNTTQLNSQNEPSFGDQSSSSKNSSVEVEVKTEIDDLSHSFSEVNAIFEDQSESFEPHKKNYENHDHYENNEKKNCECPLCHKLFKTSCAMKGHITKGHKTTLGEKFICHVCGSPASSRASLKRHLIRTHKIVNIDHPELQTKKCLHCGIGFTSHQLMYEHIRLSHKEHLGHYHHCQWCPALMKVKASLIRHIRRVHPGNEDYCSANVLCTFCHMAVANIPLLRRHMKKEHPNELFKCSLCSASFKFPYMLKRHKVLHEDPVKYFAYQKQKRYSVKCETCKRTFDSKFRLRSHIERVHTDSSPSGMKIYKCRLCGASFSSAKQK